MRLANALRTLTTPRLESIVHQFRHEGGRVQATHDFFHRNSGSYSPQEILRILICGRAKGTVLQNLLRFPTQIKGEVVAPIQGFFRRFQRIVE
jgi:hypothetical protein